MKARAIWLAVPLMVGVAFAQSTQADRTGQQQTKPESGSQGGSQADRTGQQSAAQAGSTTGAPAAGMTGQPAEMKTTWFKGTLVDLACGSATASSGAGQSDANAAPKTGQPAASSADRASGGDCPVTANSTKLGLKTDGGQVYRFDLVGNQRAQDALKTNKGWTKKLTENKPLKVKASGVLQGDKLIVSSID